MVVTRRSSPANGILAAVSFIQAQGFPKDLVMGADGKKGNGQFWYPKSETPPPDRKDDPKTTDAIVNEVVQFIDAHKDKPFFAYLPFLAVHVPIGARAELVAKYDKKKASAPEDAWGKERENQVRLVQNHAKYAAMLEQLDTGIGRVMVALEKNGLTEKTIVVFMSDNGGLATAEGHPTSNLPLRRQRLALRGRHPRTVDRLRPRRDQARQHLRHTRHQH